MWNSKKISGLKTPANSPVDPISANATGKTNGVVSFLFFSIFLAAGAVAFWLMVVAPLHRIQQAKTWTPTACVIKASSVSSHHDSKGKSTYSVYIAYTYNIGGRQYESDRYSFLEARPAADPTRRMSSPRIPRDSKPYAMSTPPIPPTPC